jgi:hypothetical protein
MRRGPVVLALQENGVSRRKIEYEILERESGAARHGVGVDAQLDRQLTHRRRLITADERRG